MSVFADLTDEQLDEAITSLAARIRTGSDTPAIKSIAGEGRRIEYATANAADLRRLHREAKEEREHRAGGLGGHAIGVRF